MKDESRREGVGKISGGVGAVEIDVADIDIESGGVFVVVANYVDEIYSLLKFNSSVEIFVAL